MKKETNTLIMAVLALVLLGTLMMYSIDAVRGPKSMILYKHLAFLGLGLIGFFFTMILDYHVLGSPAVRKAFLIGTLILLACTFIPGLRLSMGGAYRWIGWKQLSFQPAELARFTLVLMLAVRLSKQQDNMSYWTTSLVKPGFYLGLFAGIVVLQKDLGIPVVMSVATFIIIWTAGARIAHLGLAGAVGITAIIPLIAMEGYRATRIKSFMDPWAARDSHGYQLIQSLSSFYQGGVWGRGVGFGEQKLGYLPAAHTDFIFAMIGEELGLVGTIVVVLLFTAILIAGIRTVVRAPDLFGSLLAVGITTLIVFQAFFVMLVNLGWLPTKGLPLPFVSYGGSALMTNLWMAGVLINIASQASEKEKTARSSVFTHSRLKYLFRIFLPKKPATVRI